MRSLLKKAPFELKSLDLNDLVGETVEFILAVGRKVKLDSVVTPDALPILGDRIQLQQVILNLVVNGIDAMKDTPAETRVISIRTSRVENFAQLSVSDRGPGHSRREIEGGLRTVLHQQGGRHGHGAVHRAHHCRGAQRADMGRKSGSRRRDVSDQASSCPLISRICGSARPTPSPPYAAAPSATSPRMALSDRRGTRIDAQPRERLGGRSR